jgi:hypothetical protein
MKTVFKNFTKDRVKSLIGLGLTLPLLTLTLTACVVEPLPPPGPPPPVAAAPGPWCCSYYNEYPAYYYAGPSVSLGYYGGGYRRGWGGRGHWH